VFLKECRISYAYARVRACVCVRAVVDIVDSKVLEQNREISARNLYLKEK
jgi:hypothetical protein